MQKEITSSITIHTLQELENFGKNLAQKIKKNSIVLLSGDLGAGKTTLAGFIINALKNIEENITSPTFSIVNEYYSDLYSCKIFHFDLYRINDKKELYAIGFEEMIENNISIIEWPDIIKNTIHINSNTIKISININSENDIRIIEMIHNT